MFRPNIPVEYMHWPLTCTVLLPAWTTVRLTRFTSCYCSVIPIHRFPYFLCSFRWLRLELKISPLKPATKSYVVVDCETRCWFYCSTFLCTSWEVWEMVMCTGKCSDAFIEHVTILHGKSQWSWAVMRRGGLKTVVRYVRDKLRCSGDNPLFWGNKDCFHQWFLSAFFFAV